jgi:hypothetical protein
MGGLSAPRWRSLAGLFVLCAVLGLSIFLFSPWHRHARASSTPCPFSTFEHSAGEEVAGPEIPTTPPAQWFWLCTQYQPAVADLTTNSEALVRAPPAQ